MNCPYCLSEVAVDAYVCKTCTRDIYLFKPMMAKVADLEKKLAEKPSSEIYELRIAELEQALEDQNEKLEKKSLLGSIGDFIIYLIVPLALLLLAHWLITVVYDTKMIYLRIISMLVPLPFAYFLFKGHARKLLPWFVGVVFLAIASVIGMSWITSLVDRTPVWPQNLFEWKEVLEYSASIAFSFLTGMLLGGVAYASRQRLRRAGLVKSIMQLASLQAGNGAASLQNVHGLMKSLQEYGGTVVALGTTAVSIYTGLKGIIGS
jgi:positive regulator of sigma E activity